MNRTSMRILLIAFFLTLIILGTLAGLTIAAFNTQSAMTPMDAPASAQIAEDGSCYQFSFFGQHFTLPRFPVKEVEDVINRYPVLIPKSIVFFTYGADFLSDYLAVSYTHLATASKSIQTLRDSQTIKRPRGRKGGLFYEAQTMEGTDILRGVYPASRRLTDAAASLRRGFF